MAAAPASQPSGFEPADEIRIENIEMLKVVFDNRRMQILEAFSKQPRTVKEVADELKATPHSLYYHVNMLEEHGLLIVTDTRMVSGILEKRYQMAARHFIIAPGLLSFGAEGDSAGLNILLNTILDGMRTDIKRSARAGVINLERKAPDPAALMLRRGFTHMTPDQAHAFYERLLGLLDEFVAIDRANEESPNENGTLYTFSVAFYPTLPVDDEQ